MNDFLNIDWDHKNIENYNMQNCPFIDNLNDSYAYTKIRNKNSEEKFNIEKIHSTKEYVPGLSYFKKKSLLSCLNKNQQEMCLQALKIYQSGKTNLLPNEQRTMDMYLKLKDKINEENMKFLNHAKFKWEKIQKNVNIKPSLKKFGVNHWKSKLKLLSRYAQFYRQYETLTFSIDENSETTQMAHMENLLELGNVAAFIQPKLIMKTILQEQMLPANNDIEQLPVSMDDVVSNLLQKVPDIDVVMSSSSLTKFINYMDNSESWDLPLVIKYASNNKKVIYIDKSLARKQINLNHINSYVHKVLLKTNFCAREEFSFPIKKLDLCEDKQDEKLSDVTEQKIILNKEKGKVHQNVSYRTWNLHMNIDENNLSKFKHKFKHFKVLIRSKVDACEKTENGSYTPVCTYSKLENQLNYGANIPTKPELAKQWVLLSSRPFSKLYRAHIHRSTSEVIFIENCCLQKINGEALHHHNYKPYQGLTLLYKILNEIQTYEAANYLLRYSPKTGPFLLVLKECDKNFPNAYDLYNDYETNSNFSQVADPYWCPIDVNFILPSHNYYKQLPGLFTPRATVSKVLFKKTGIKQKRKKKKQKNTKL